jgi:hypothetical protein
LLSIAIEARISRRDLAKRLAVLEAKAKPRMISTWVDIMMLEDDDIKVELSPRMQELVEWQPMKKKKLSVNLTDNHKTKGQGYDTFLGVGFQEPNSPRCGDSREWRRKSWAVDPRRIWSSASCKASPVSWSSARTESWHSSIL